VKQILFGCSGIFLLSLFLLAQEAKKEDYIIGPEDVLTINVWKEPDLSMKELVVRPDGKISMPLVNEIQASGMSPKQLQEQIAVKLREFVETPIVNVTVIRVFSHSVSVVGQVGKPGLYPLNSPATVLNIIARAGGLTEFAKEKNIKVLRNENGKTLQFPFNYKDVINGKNLQQNIFLKSGDTITVP
jgi:polysaccharide biosynthesis/export protein